MEGDVDKTMKRSEEGGLTPSTTFISTAEFYESLRAFTTRSEVQLMIETTLNSKQQGNGKTLSKEASSHDMTQLNEKHLQQIVSEEVKQQVGNVVRDVYADIMQQQEEVSSLQREHIMNALREVEQRVNVLQREVNELSHKYRNTYKLLTQLCCAIEGATDDMIIFNDNDNNNSSSSRCSSDSSHIGKSASQTKNVEGTQQHSRLLDALLQALENNQLDEVRVLVAASLSPFVAVATQEQQQQQRDKKENNERNQVDMMMDSHHMVSSHVNTVLTPHGESLSQESSISHLLANITPRNQFNRIKSIATTEKLSNAYINKNKNGMVSPRSLTARVNTQEVVLHPYASVPTLSHQRGIENMNENYPNNHPFECNYSRKYNNRSNNTNNSEVDLNKKKNVGGCGWYSIGNNSSNDSNHKKNHHNINNNNDNRETPSLGIEAVDAPSELLPVNLSRSSPIDSIVSSASGGGVHVLGIVRGGAAARSGVLIGDIILAVESRRVPTCEHLAQTLQDLFITHGSLKGVMLSVYRHSSRAELGISIA
ncbi:uncharacterized protein TM35_000251210 [Trypanosoma theileri]|uniref:PDZ domain-containing protein n=1 Tax=Trypanosoma theileri TaxID=67003 RepID=A0A1X0NQ38_9TRYP|nr:uncharacterized protein TM35_000251210 [Trypanosoma theileri]ORC86825.1 hypothetical protein TM35_000251210 [Trypanosoma theileri]